MESLVPVEVIEGKILLIRGKKVMLDSDLAGLYGVTTKRLNEQVRRNRGRFPEDFMFQLNPKEFESLRSQFVISKGKGGRRYPPYAFTEQGVAMLSSVLNSTRAIRVNITIMRVFIRLRQMTAGYRALAANLVELEERIQDHDVQIKDIFQAIRQLMIPPEKAKRKIGFLVKEKQARYGRGKGR